MASICKQPGRRCYYCAYSLHDKATGKMKRVFRTTGTTNKKQALAMCNAWEQAAHKGRDGKLTPEAARAIIERGIQRASA
ncbi:MAG TPA: hypothetical protein VGK65_24110 [Candidatus Binatia bacterium]|jgi:hypothetical protein